MRYVFCFWIIVLNTRAIAQELETPPVCIDSVNVSKDHYSYVEEMPHYEEGEKAMFKFIQKHIVYPEKEKKTGLKEKY